MREDHVTNFRHTPTRSMGLQFWKVSQLWQKRIAAALKPYDLTHTQFVILAAIKWHEEQTSRPSQTGIAKLTNIEKMTLSKAIRKLETSGLITREVDSSDTRSKSISLTNSVQETLRSATRAIEQVDEEFFGCLSGKQPGDLFGILATLDGQQPD